MRSLRTHRIIAVTAVCCLVITTVWLLIPVKNIPASAFLPMDQFGFLRININAEKQDMAGFLDSVKSRLADSASNRFKRFFVKKAFQPGLPRRITVTLCPGKDSLLPELGCVIGMDRIIRPVRLFHAPLRKMLLRGKTVKKMHMDGLRFFSVSPISGQTFYYRFVRNTILVSPSPNLLIRMSKQPDRNGSVDSGRIIPLLYKGACDVDGFFFMDNLEGNVTSMIQPLEETFSFAAFPSIDRVSMIAGWIDCSAGGLNIDSAFFTNAEFGLAQVQSDVRYLYGALRRILRSSDIGMKGEISSRSHSVLLQCRLSRRN